MSIFNTSNLIGTVTPLANESASAQSTLVLSPQVISYQAPLHYAIFYTGGGTFSGTYGKFVKS